MMVGRDGWRSRLVRAAVVAAAAALLASCGGGQQVQKFAPGRVLAFGDETSIVESDGRKYTVNAQTATTDTPPLVLDCAQNPIWVQVVANAYAVPFDRCPGTAASAPSRILATANATVAAVAAQIDQFLLSDSFRANDLVTLMAGAHDLLALYDRVVAGGLSVEQAAAAAEQAGTDLAGQVNRIAAAGAKVLIATIPDQSLTPIGRSAAATPMQFQCPRSDGRVDNNGADLLHCLSQRFNAKLRTSLVNDGRMIGLVLFDELLQSLVNNTTIVSTDRACNDATIGDTDLSKLLDCSSQTLRTPADGTTVNLSTWLWADGLRIAPVGHSNLGSLAFTRASNNPF